MRYGWTITHLPWKQLEELFGEQKWANVPLDASARRSIPNQAGVYLICAGLKHVPVNGRPMQKLYNVIYAGQARNLRQRFAQHVAGFGDVVAAKRTFRQLDFWYTGAPQEALSELEQRLIDAFGPPANNRNARARIGEPIPAGQIGEDTR
jgi:hypothetical protein